MVHRLIRLGQLSPFPIAATTALTSPVVGVPSVSVLIPLPLGSPTRRTSLPFFVFVDQGNIPVLLRPIRFPVLNYPTGEDAVRDSVFGGVGDSGVELGISSESLSDKGRPDLRLFT